MEAAAQIAKYEEEYKAAKAKGGGNIVAKYRALNALIILKRARKICKSRCK